MQADFGQSSRPVLLVYCAAYNGVDTLFRERSQSTEMVVKKTPSYNVKSVADQQIENPAFYGAGGSSFWGFEFLGEA